jgi:phosphoserine phosphatase
MKIITYRPQLKEVESSYMKSDKNYVNFLRNTNPEISIISKTDKKFIENLAKFLQLESNVSLNTSSIKEFVKSLFTAKIFVESTKTTKVSSKAVSVKKKIGSTDSVISLSKIKEFAESIKQIERDKFKRSRKIQKFIEENTPLVNAEDLQKGATIWVFSGAPQYYIGRAKLEYKSSSKSPNFVTLYLTDDNKYEEWRKQDSYANSMKDFDQISIPAIRFGEGKYYKSVKKDKKIPLG